jgi:hypothetical protein
MMMVVDNSGHENDLLAIRGGLFDDIGLTLLVNACENCDAVQSRSNERVSQACL